MSSNGNWKCIPEIRKKILDGELPVEILRNEKVGEIKANIVEKNGMIVMVAMNAKHEPRAPRIPNLLFQYPANKSAPNSHSATPRK